jgi:hypothetical protein
MSTRLLEFIQNATNQKQTTVDPFKIFAPLIQFFSQLETQKLNDNIPQVGKKRHRVYELRLIVEIINDVCTELPYINLEDLVNILNHDFDFFVTDFIKVFGAGETSNILFKQTGVKVNNIQDEASLATLLKFKNLAGYLVFQPHMLVVRYFLNPKFPQLSTKRRLHVLDFQQVCYQRMSIAMIFQVCQFYKKYYAAATQQLQIDGKNIDPLGIYMMIDFLAHKITRQSKLFIVDNVDVNPNQFKPKIFEHVDVVQELSRAWELTKNIINIESPILSLLKVIQQELSLIETIIQFNILCIEGQFDLAKEFLLRFSSSASITEHQICLLAQTVHSQLQTNNKLSPVIKAILEEVITGNIRVKKCSLYFDNMMKVKCYHKTFSFYVIYKWYQAFIKLINRYKFESSGFDPNISPSQFTQYHDEFLDPKISFCNQCYDHYKSYEKEIAGNKSSDLFTLVRERAFASVFRLRFSDSCDIPSQPIYSASQRGHFGEYQNALAATNIEPCSQSLPEAIKPLLNKLMAMLRKEIFNAQKAVQAFVVEDEDSLYTQLNSESESESQGENEDEEL